MAGKRTPSCAKSDGSRNELVPLGDAWFELAAALKSGEVH